MLIEAHGLRKTYPMGTAEVHALRGVDLEVALGEFVAPAPARLSRSPERRVVSTRRRGGRITQRPRAVEVAKSTDRVRLPGLPPHPPAYRPGKRRAALDLSRHGQAAQARPQHRDPRAGRPRR